MARERGGEAGISVTTVYRAFGRGLLFHGSKKCLRRKGRRYRRAADRKADGRGHIRNAVSISMRPKYPVPHMGHRRAQGSEEEGRHRALGRRHGVGTPTRRAHAGSGGVMTLVERKSRYVLIRKIPDTPYGAQVPHTGHRPDERGDAGGDRVSVRGTGRASAYPKGTGQTLTVDNGKEFAWHEKMSAALGGLPIYFAHPGRPCTRRAHASEALTRTRIPKGHRRLDTGISAEGDRLP